jgi:hypothetical protein
MGLSSLMLGNILKARCRRLDVLKTLRSGHAQRNVRDGSLADMATSLLYPR